MKESNSVPEDRRQVLLQVASDLHGRYQGLFGQETIEALVFDSYTQVANAKIADWLVASAELLANERLEELLRSEDHSPKSMPSVLFLCTHNAGRSQMALGWLTHLGSGRVTGWSAGSEPEIELDKVAVEAMAEAGIDISGSLPKPWTDEVLAAADVVVTMGCGDVCPLVLGKHYEDWAVDDPAGQPLEAVRPIRDDLEARVRDLLVRIGVSDIGSPRRVGRRAQ